MVDGDHQKRGGKDWIVEEFLAFSDPKRFDCTLVMFPQTFMSYQMHS